MFRGIWPRLPKVTVVEYKSPAESSFRPFTAEEILATYPPEHWLAGMPPEHWLAGVPPEQQVLALSDEVLRGFSDSYLQTLSPEVQEVIRRRIGRPASAG